MAKGQKQAAEKQLDLTNKVGGQELGQANQLEGQLIPGYTSLMDTGYLSPTDEAAATTSEMGAATAPFSAANFGAANRAAATRNPADLTAQQDQLAQEKGVAAGGAAADLQRQKMANQEAGMYGINQLEQGNLGAAESMYGLGPGTLSARAQGQNVLSQIAGQAMGAAGVAACWILRAVYGDADPRPNLVANRWWSDWAANSYPARLALAAYMIFGQPIGWLVKKSTFLKSKLKPFCDELVYKATYGR